MFAKFWWQSEGHYIGFQSIVWISICPGDEYSTCDSLKEASASQGVEGQVCSCFTGSKMTYLTSSLHGQLILEAMFHRKT